MRLNLWFSHPGGLFPFCASLWWALRVWSKWPRWDFANLHSPECEVKRWPKVACWLMRGWAGGLINIALHSRTYLPPFHPSLLRDLKFSSSVSTLRLFNSHQTNSARDRMSISIAPLWIWRLCSGWGTGAAGGRQGRKSRCFQGSESKKPQDQSGVSAFWQHLLVREIFPASVHRSWCNLVSTRGNAACLWDSAWESHILPLPSQADALKSSSLLSFPSQPCGLNTWRGLAEQRKIPFVLGWGHAILLLMREYICCYPYSVVRSLIYRCLKFLSPHQTHFCREFIATFHVPSTHLIRTFSGPSRNGADLWGCILWWHVSPHSCKTGKELWAPFRMEWRGLDSWSPAQAWVYPARNLVSQRFLGFEKMLSSVAFERNA